MLIKLITLKNSILKTGQYSAMYMLEPSLKLKTNGQTMLYIHRLLT